MDILFEHWGIMYCQRTAKNSRRKKENKTKARKLKEKRMQQRVMSLLAKLTSKEVTGEAFEAIMHNEKPKRVGSIKPESTRS